MRGICTLTLNPPINTVVEACRFISKGPYMGEDALLIINNLCGGYYVIRQSFDGVDKGKPSETVFGFDLAMNIAKEMIAEQSNRDCSAVTGGGRWGCE